MDILEKFFKLKDNNTTVKTELLAGLTTFFTMSYLLVLSPKLLEFSGMELLPSLTVTALVTFICSIIMGFVANKPYAVAPFLGETAFIAYTITGTLGFSVKSAFASVFICGLILLIMTLTNIRSYVVEQIPENIKYTYCVGLGLFFIFISLRDIGIVEFSQDSLIAGNFLSVPVILGIFCFISIIILTKKGIKGAVLISIILTTILGVIFKDVDLPNKLISVPAGISASFFQTDFPSLLSKNFLPIFFVIFLLVNIDTAGAIVSLEAEMKKDEKAKDRKKTMIADSLSVIIAPVFGTTTSGAFIDSITGISTGGKTGLTAITVGVLFLLGLLFTPSITIIPPYAYAPALLYVGILMSTAITKINFYDLSEYAPAVLTICMMVFTNNIGLGIVTAFITYPLIKVLCGQKEKTNIVSWVMFALSLIFFWIYPY